MNDMIRYYRRFIKFLLIVNAVLLAVICLLLIGDAHACISEVARATTDVYIRDDRGEIVGSLYTGDRVVWIGKDGGWARVEIGGKEYNVWNDFLEITGDSADDAEITTKPRTSKSAARQPDKNGVINKSKHKIGKGSIFADW